MFDVIVVGSGAAGTFAAYGLKGLKVLMLDVGHKPSDESIPDSLYKIKNKQSLFQQIIGRRFESLHEIEFRKLTPKAKAPLMRYVTQEPECSPKILSEGFYPTVSFAEGGLANIWGAQVYRFDDEDLKGFPLTTEALSPFYEELINHIGISGSEDDLNRFFGDTSGMMPAIQPGRLGLDILTRYQRKAKFFHKQGIYLGLPRLAVLSRDYGERKKCAYDNLEFLQSRHSAIYSPAFTLEELIKNQTVHYLPDRMVESYQEQENQVTVTARNISEGTVEQFQARKVILCLGAFNTARLVLFSNNDLTSELPVVENPFSLVPLLSLSRIGLPIEQESFSAQLCLAYSGPLAEDLVIAMIYGIESIARSDMLFEFPLALSGCLEAAKFILPAMAVMQVYHSSDPQRENVMKVNGDGSMTIKFTPIEHRSVEEHLIKVFRRIGYISFASHIQPNDPGLSNHYAGPLPMRAQPRRPYETSPEGLLFGCRNVYVGDSAGFPRLPAKNLTFTIMANALRIGRHVKSLFEL